MAIDLHRKPFDEGTKVKLSLYRNYMQEWLPVFLRKGSAFRHINIFDFFCGPGKDDEGQKFKKNSGAHKPLTAVFGQWGRNGVKPSAMGSNLDGLLPEPGSN